MVRPRCIKSYLAINIINSVLTDIHMQTDRQTDRQTDKKTSRQIANCKLHPPGFRVFVEIGPFVDAVTIDSRSNSADVAGFVVHDVVAGTTGSASARDAAATRACSDVAGSADTAGSADAAGSADTAGSNTTGPTAAADAQCRRHGAVSGETVAARANTGEPGQGAARPHVLRHPIDGHHVVDGGLQLRQWTGVSTLTRESCLRPASA